MDILLLLFTVGLIVGLYYFFTQKKAPAPQVKKEEPKTTEKAKAKTKEPAPSTQGVSNKDLKRQELELKKNQKKIKKTNPTHPSFLRGFKGFKDKITDFDVTTDGLYLVACSPDCTFRIFKSKDIKEQEPLSVYQKIETYEPGSISISQDKKMVAVGMSDTQVVQLFTIEESVSYEDGDKTKITFNQIGKTTEKLQKTYLKHLFLDYNSKFFVTGSDEEDTTVKVWGISGESLATFNTAQLKNHHIHRSNGGQFYAIGAWTSDVMILEIKTNRDGSFKSLAKAMTLKGHRQGLIDLAFNNLDSRVVTFSKDQTIKVWDVNVRYELSEDPKCLATININDFAELKNLGGLVRIALYTYEDNSKSLIVIAQNNNLIIFNVEKNKIVDTIQNIHSEGSAVNKIVFRSHGGLPYLYTSADDGRVNMWDLSSF